MAIARAPGGSTSADLDEAGLVLVPGALAAGEVAALAAAALAVADAERTRVGVDPRAPVHLLEFLDRDPAFPALVDNAAVLPLVVAALGWNIHVYHSHLDVHPPAPPGPAVWRWHQDGGRQNLDIEGSPRPRLSVKVAWFLSDCTVPGRGNMLVIPGSHRDDVLARPADPAADAPLPPCAEPVLARPGDALIFDRRLWHARSDNRSTVTRVALFCAYTYRWIRPRGVYPRLVADASQPPVRRQLLGAAAGPTGHWLPTAADVPLRRA